MKAIKTLLLSTAAGLVTVTAGQAAELPVKAGSIEYVKVCSVYGAGFYYMPGTDMCIRIGGYVRVEATDPANGNLTWGPFNANDNTRQTDNMTVRAKAFITADAREQTGYGDARAYIRVGVDTDDVGLSTTSNAFLANRAFVQWAGFTAGLARSFYDFYDAEEQNYRAGYLPQENTGVVGWWIWAYTAELGGGVSATISAEERRITQIVDDSGLAAASSLSAMTRGAVYGGWQSPDIVGNIAVEQTWGSAQIMAAGHELNPLYYLQANNTTTPGVDETNGHPGDQWGWVVGAGIRLKTPFITSGDYIYGEINYTEGAFRYLDFASGTTMTFADGGQQSYGIMADCVYGGIGATATGCEKTTGWSAILSYEHYWTPEWHESFTGAYMAVTYDTAANNMLCALEDPTQGAGIGATAAALSGCNNNWSYWGAGSRLQWDVAKNFYVGVEALYLQQNTASSATGFVPAANGLANVCNTGVCKNSDEHTWVFTVRMHRDFLP
jgi:hypothetical protein